jgi:RNA recognition motif-containing protein
MGVFFWGCQLVRSYSPKYSSHRLGCPKDAGTFNFWHYLQTSAHRSISIVEFASQEDSQRAVRELSETPLLGRPVFIREVSKHKMFLRIWIITLRPGPRD